MALVIGVLMLGGLSIAQAEPGPRNTPPTADSLHGAAPAAQTVKGEQTATGANTSP